jgi:hypothetical protein
MMIKAGVGDLVQRTRDGQAQVGYSMAAQSRSWVILCVVCIMHKERGVQISWFSLKTKVNSFSWSGLKTGVYGFSRFDLKTGGYDSYDLALKPLTRFSRFGPQNW